MTTVRILDLKDLGKTKLAELVEMHSTTMPTLLSELGRPFVEKYYLAGLCAENAIGFGAVDVKGEIVGWVFGSDDPSKLNQQLTKPPSWFLFNILKAMIRSPRLGITLLQSARTQPGNSLEPGQLELTYIGIHPEIQGQGIGRQLIDRFIDKARERGYSQVALSVESENLPAIGLYKKIGFDVISTFTEGHYHRHRMILNLEKGK